MRSRHSDVSFAASAATASRVAYPARGGPAPFCPLSRNGAPACVVDFLGYGGAAPSLGLALLGLCGLCELRYGQPRPGCELVRPGRHERTKVPQARPSPAFMTRGIRVAGGPTTSARS